MAVDRNANRAVFSASGDIITSDMVQVASMFFHSGTTSGTVYLQDGAGNSLVNVVLAANDREVVEQPFGDRMIQGVQTSTMPAGSVVTVVFG